MLFLIFILNLDITITPYILNSIDDVLVKKLITFIRNGWNIQSWYFQKKVFKEKEIMGKFKTVFVTCLGLGIAAGASYYLYKKFLRKDGEDEDDSSAQVKLGTLILSDRVKKKNG